MSFCPLWNKVNNTGGPYKWNCYVLIMQHMVRWLETKKPDQTQGYPDFSLLEQQLHLRRKGIFVSDYTTQNCPSHHVGPYGASKRSANLSLSSFAQYFTTHDLFGENEQCSWYFMLKQNHISKHETLCDPGHLTFKTSSNQFLSFIFTWCSTAQVIMLIRSTILSHQNVKPRQTLKGLQLDAFSP